MLDTVVIIILGIFVTPLIISLCLWWCDTLLSLYIRYTKERKDDHTGED